MLYGIFNICYFYLYNSSPVLILIILNRQKLNKAAIAAEHAHYLSNKEITTPNQIYGIKCPKTNIRTTAGKPVQPRRVVVDLKVG